MKKLMLFASALAGLFLAASCQQENLEPAAKGNAVTFTVEAPAALQTKAIADGMNVDELIYEVWITNGQTNDLSGAQKLYQSSTEMFKEDGKNKATVTLDLVNDQNYTVLFWAQVAAADAYNTNELTAVTYAKDIDAYAANDESLAAFYAVSYIDDDTAANQTVYLTRPFAQVNLCTLNSKAAAQQAGDYNIAIVNSKMTLKNVPTEFNVATGDVDGYAEFVFTYAPVPSDPATIKVSEKEYYYAGMNYVFAGDNLELTYDIQTSLNGSTNYAVVNNVISSVPVKKNYRTNIVGNLLTSKTDYEIIVDADFADEDLEGGKFGFIDGKKYVKVEDTQEFNEAFVDPTVDIIILSEDVVLTQTLTRATTDYTLTVASGKTLTIDLNGKKISSTSTQTGGNYNMFDVRGTLTVKNGTIEYKHLGENMGWGSSTNIFNVTAGGVLNLEGVTATNLGGSDMGFVAHLNNWGEVTLNVDNCTLESNYVPVRVFNSGNDMNNVTIKNSTLKGNSAAFWVHNYTVEDFGSAEKAEAQKALLNLNIYNQGNTFSPDLNGVRYGFTNSVRADAYGVTKVVSEDGSVVTLGSVIDGALIRRGVAGDEENTTITKVVVEEGVGVLYDRTFRHYFALETVELPSTLTTIGATGTGVFQSCTNLKNIVIPESVTVLGKGTFQDCSSLESINIPAGVTRIEENALRATGLVSVEFHKGVTYFGAQAFRDCKKLTEVIINAPYFTMESNTFGIVAAPYTPMTIYVANTAMKDYVESMLTAQAKTYITVVAPTVPETGAEADEALQNGENVTLESDLTFSASETTASSGYGATGLSVNGSVFDGNGHTVTANNAWGTWDCTISATAGTIKNVTVAGAMRGIFMPGASDDVYIDNVTFSNVIYTFNSDGGDKNYGVYISNSILNGWTSFSNVHKEVVFTNCSFGEGNGYAFCRPYNACVFENCEFSTDMEFDTEYQADIVFKNCTYGGVKITAENAASLKTGEKTFFYKGVRTVSFE